MYNIVSVDTIRHIILDVNIYFHFFLCFYIFFLCLRHNLAQRGVCQFPSISSHKAFSVGGGSNSICSKRIPIYYNNAAGGRLSSTTYTVTPYTFVTASVGSLLLSSLPDLFHEKKRPARASRFISLYSIDRISHSIHPFSFLYTGGVRTGSPSLRYRH